MLKPNIILAILRQPAVRLVTISGILFVAIAWFTVIWQIIEDRSVAKATAVRENRGRVIALEQSVRRTLDAAELSTIYLTERFGEALRPDGMSETRSIALPGYFDPIIVGVHMVDASGKVRVSTASEPLARTRIYPLFQELRNATGVTRAISNPTVKAETGETVLLIGRGIRDPRGAFVGAVMVEVPARRLVEFNAGLDDRPTDLISVISLRGMTLARREGGVTSWGQSVAGGLVMAQQRVHPNGEYWGPSVLDGKRRLFSHQRIPGYRIFVTSGVGEANILGPVMRRAGWFLTLATALTLVVGALLTLYFRHIRNGELAQLRIEQMRNEFAHSARVSSLSEMAAGLAHELNQPLTAASNYLAVGELMLRGEGSREGVAAQLHQVRGQIARAGDIIRRIRDYLSKGSAELRVERLDPIIHDAIELARGGNSAPRAQIVYAGGNGQTQVLVDRVQIQQVLVNLIRNAEEAVAHFPPSRQEIRISSTIVSDEMVEIRVDDDGPGFPDSVLDQFNMPFISTKSEHGLGIGLSICRRIIEVHGGTLRAWNRASGASTSFTVKRDVGLPVV